MVYLAETLNVALGANWQLFSRQNYFDTNGFFVSTVYSCPNILLSLMVLVRTALPRWLTLRAHEPKAGGAGRLRYVKVGCEAYVRGGS
jgi:hypothetical protein